ncbi:MAG: hypothetical protein GXP62_09150 [Oligoflexia bacterium]|nr:hypothetical protein [Oligoflexia bacterium]
MLPVILTLLACHGPDSVADTATLMTDSGVGGTTTGGTATSDVCGDLGLTSRDWVDADDDDSLYATAADVALQTSEGDLMLSSLWTGCEVFLFIQDSPAQASGWPTDLWERDVDTLFDALPRNVHLMFSSDASSSDDRDASLALLKSQVDDSLAAMDVDTAAWWASHVHYLTRRSQTLSGWLGQTMNNPGWGVGIDRFQRIRYIGSYGDPTRYNSSYGWFEPNLSMVANEAIYYNFESDRADTMDAEDATVLTLFDQDRVAGSVDSTVDLPDLSGFDTVTVDTTMACEGDGEYGYCPAWDYMAYLYMCDRPVEDNPFTDLSCQPAQAEVLGTCVVDGSSTKVSCTSNDDCTWTEGGDTGAGVTVVGKCEGYEAAIAADTLAGDCEQPSGETASATYTCAEDGSGYGDLACACSTEIGRWITTYHREGRWVYDISPMLPLLDAGGSWPFRYTTTGPYILDLDLRFSNQGKDARPQQAVYAFSGGTINSKYNAGYKPFAFTPPAGTTKVELATVISQHGADSNNCGEFCDIAHHFTVNGDESQEIVRSFPEAGTMTDCMDKTAQGTIPNQYGTWWYGRAGWCPGKEVPTVVNDITDQVTIGASNELSYRALYNGSDYGGSATILMRSWLIYSQ